MQVENRLADRHQFRRVTAQLSARDSKFRFSERVVQEREKCGLSIATKSEASGETVFGFLSSILIVSADRKPTFTKTLIVAGGFVATRHKC